jgi:phosphopantothenoylcysteine decarboxylase/phosphopantothenate--cysteine ligase
MDLDMMAHPSTKRNIEMLKSYGNHIIEPTEGELASHLVGKGRMEEPEAIVEHLVQYFTSSQDLKEKNILITAGPTYEKIDPVRFIGNYSSGKMGYAIAEEAARRGANVTLVSGPVSISTQNANINVVKVESARQMHDKCLEVFPNCDYAIMSAAVADYAPSECAETKIKREKDDIPVIKLVKNPDIAAALGNLKNNNQKLIGFALETNNEEANAIDKLKRKNLDFIILNSLQDKGAGFGTDTNKITVYSANGEKFEYGLKSKVEVAKDIIDIITK